MYKCVLVVDNPEQLAEQELGSQFECTLDATLEFEQLKNGNIASNLQQNDYLLIPVDLVNKMFAEQFAANCKSEYSKGRETIVARSHQGIKKINVSEVVYFMADQKYVTAYYTDGQLLLEESLTSLEHDLGYAFIRIHRKILLAVDQIISLSKNENGEHYVLLKDKTTKLVVSRRQLAKVRKAISNV